MSIEFACECGKYFKLRDELAGKRGKCPDCGRVLQIPQPTGEDEEFGPIALAEPEPPRPANPRPAEPPAYAPRQPLAAVAARVQPRLLVAAPRPLRDFAYLTLMVLLVPLAIFTIHKDDPNDIEQRASNTIEHLSPQDQANIRRLAERGEVSDKDLLALLPGGRIEGALLAYNTHAHWFYAALAAAAFFGLLLVLFPRDEARWGHLAASAIFTGTLGILLLLGVQYAAAWTYGRWFTGRSILALVFYFVKFIGFSYRAALDPNTNFFVSFFGFTCGVGFCEELCKALPLMWYYRIGSSLSWRGACLWGLASGMGFGIAEAIMYSADYYNGLQGGGIYWVRFVSCVGLHAIWAGAVGIMIARHGHMLCDAESFWHLLLNVVGLLAVAMALHGLYDTLLKKDHEGWALLTALGSFAYLAWSVERATRLEPRTSAGLAPG